MHSSPTSYKSQINNVDNRNMRIIHPLFLFLLYLSQSVCYPQLWRSAPLRCHKGQGYLWQVSDNDPLIQVVPPASEATLWPPLIGSPSLQWQAKIFSSGSIGDLEEESKLLLRASPCLAAQAFITQKPAAVIFILGFVIYRSGKEAKEYSPKSQKNRSAITHSPWWFFNLYSEPITRTLGGITGSLSRSPPATPPAIFSQLVLELEPATFHPLGLLLYTLVHRLLQGFRRPCCFTKKVTCWRPDSHGNTSLFVWPDNSLLRSAPRLTWILLCSSTYVLPTMRFMLVLILSVTLLFILSSCL